MPKLATHVRTYEPRILRIHLDEAGRGPLAGPVRVGAVMAMDNTFDRTIFRDSKQLSPQQREELYTSLHHLEEHQHLFTGTGRADNHTIDQQGIITALREASSMAIFDLLRKYYLAQWQQELMQSTYGIDQLAHIALTKLFRKRKITPTLIGDIIAVPNTIARVHTVLIDGNNTFKLDEYLSCAITPIIKGDSKNPLISAASILAKVERDAYMEHISPLIPTYSLGINKGYGTPTHIRTIRKHGLSPLHRVTFCKEFIKHKKKQKTTNQPLIPAPATLSRTQLPQSSHFHKPPLLLHICCAPDLTWPLHRLKKHFKLYLFRYNPNIHPRQEHTKRYEQFMKLVGLEKGDYEILEDRYDPKEFFQAMFEQRTTIDPKLHDAPQRTVLQVAGSMEEWSDRCNPCYSMRLEQAARMASKEGIPYFTSTLLISPKKKMDKLFLWGVEAERRNPGTKFLWFDFAKNQGYNKASKLTKKHGLRRQQYCGCGWTVRTKNENYTGG